MKEILDKISELEQRIVELKAEVEKEEKENKSTNKRWRAECKVGIDLGIKDLSRCKKGSKNREECRIKDERTGAGR